MIYLISSGKKIQCDLQPLSEAAKWVAEPTTLGVMDQTVFGLIVVREKDVSEHFNKIKLMNMPQN